MAQILNRGAPLGDYRCTCFQQGLCSTTPWTLKTWTGGRAFGNLTGALSWAGDWTEDLQAMVWVQVPEGKHVIKGKKGSFTFFRLNGSIRNKIAMLFSSVLWVMWRQNVLGQLLGLINNYLAKFRVTFDAGKNVLNGLALRFALNLWQKKIQHYSILTQNVLKLVFGDKLFDPIKLNKMSRLI